MPATRCAAQCSTANVENSAYGSRLTLAKWGGFTPYLCQFLRLASHAVNARVNKVTSPAKNPGSDRLHILTASNLTWRHSLSHQASPFGSTDPLSSTAAIPTHQLKRESEKKYQEQFYESQERLECWWAYIIFIFNILWVTCYEGFGVLKIV